MSQDHTWECPIFGYRLTGYNLDIGLSIVPIPNIAAIAPGHEAFRTAAVLRRTGAAPPVQTRIGLASIQLEPFLDADLMAPGDVEIVLMDKPGGLAESQRRQRDVRRRRCHLP